MFHRVIICSAVIALSSAYASPLAFQLRLSGGSSGVPGATNDRPLITITNTSTVASQITRMELTIGDPLYNWDVTYFDARAGVAASSASTPDGGNGGVRSNVLAWNFTGFDAVLNTALADEWVRVAGEVDPNAGEATVDYRTILFNNNGAANAIATLFFQHGGTQKRAVLTLGDQPSGQSVHVFNGAVPEPGTMSLAVAGLAAIVGSRFRRRS